MLIIDNLFSKEETEYIKSTLLSNAFPWYYIESTLGEYSESKKDSKTVEYIMFGHVFVTEDENKGVTIINSEKYLPLIEMIIDKLQYRLKRQLTIYRAKANFQPKVTTNLVHNTPHIDYLLKENYMTMIYYVNDSDGKTFLFKNRKNHDDVNEDWVIEDTIASKEGRVVLFDGKRMHTGSHPKEGIRLVINFVLKFEEGIF